MEDPTQQLKAIYIQLSKEFWPELSPSRIGSKDPCIKTYLFFPHKIKSLQHEKALPGIEAFHKMINDKTIPTEILINGASKVF